MALSTSTTAITLSELKAAFPTQMFTFVGTYKEDPNLNASTTGALKEVWYSKNDDKLYVVVTRNL